MNGNSPETRAADSAGLESTEVPAKMQAMLLHRYGSAENFVLGEMSTPTYKTDQVLIRVRAAGVNPIDWRIRSGSLRWILPASLPLVLGFDVAGQIVKAGAEAQQQGWNAGDEVLCMLDNRHGGGYAGYAAAGADVLARKPSVLSFEEASSVPLAASTALQALRDQAQLKPGHELLVNGASGGVGTFAVQMGKALGAMVTGVCSDDNLDYVRELGADRVIDYREKDFASLDRAFDVIFDAAAKSSYSKCRRVLGPHGCYVTTVPSPGSLFSRVTSMLGKRRCRHILVRPNGEDLRWIIRMIEEGRLRTEIQQVYPLNEVAAAHAVSETGHVRGKLVLSAKSLLGTN
jgi:NADPH:quinone reductase-like Zn-dependent oxidoreductase